MLYVFYLTINQFSRCLLNWKLKQSVLKAAAMPSVAYLGWGLGPNSERIIHNLKMFKYSLDYSPVHLLHYVWLNMASQKLHLLGHGQQLPGHYPVEGGLGQRFGLFSPIANNLRNLYWMADIHHALCLSVLMWELHVQIFSCQVG